MDVLPKRFGKYGLTLHPEKTRLLPFRRPPFKSKLKGRDETPGTFDLLGFTHYWGRSRLGNWVIKRRTAKDRFNRAVKRISEWCRRNRHVSVSGQHQSLLSKLRGHYSYYGLTGNGMALSRFRYKTLCTWKKWLNRRSQNARMGWQRFLRLLEQYPIPEPLVVHSIHRCVANP
jgi:hypothetical protein